MKTIDAKVFQPKLLHTLKNYNRQTLMSDIMAGIIVGIVALPLAIAFGIASGVTPEKGIITAIVAGLIISIFGGSKVQIGGPTGAFIIIIYGIIQQYGIEGLTIATLMAGAFLVLFGVLQSSVVALHHQLQHHRPLVCTGRRVQRCNHCHHTTFQQEDSRFARCHYHNDSACPFAKELRRCNVHRNHWRPLCHQQRTAGGTGA